MSDEMIGIGLALLAAIAWGATAVFTRIGLQYVRTSTGVLVSMVAGVVLIGAIAIPLHSEEIGTLTLVALGWIALMGLLNFPLGRFLNFTGVRLAGVARATPLFSTSPLFATILAILFLGETVTLFTLTGILVIVGGIALITSEGV